MRGCSTGSQDICGALPAAPPAAQRFVVLSLVAASVVAAGFELPRPARESAVSCAGAGCRAVATLRILSHPPNPATHPPPAHPPIQPPTACSPTHPATHRLPTHPPEQAPYRGLFEGLSKHCCPTNGRSAHLQLARGPAGWSSALAAHAAHLPPCDVCQPPMLAKPQ